MNMYMYMSTDIKQMFQVLGKNVHEQIFLRCNVVSKN